MTEGSRLESFQVRGMLDSLYEGFQVLSPEWRYLYVNESVARHGRKQRDDLLGNSMLTCFPGIENMPVYEKLERCMRERVADTFETEFEFANGERAWFELRVRPCREGLIVLSLDVTGRKRIQAKLNQEHKLRALGELAVGVAHDLKNILNPLTLQVEVLKGLAKSDPRALQILDRMSAVLENGSDTINRLRDFGRQSSGAKRTVVDLSRVAREARDLCAPRLAVAGRVVRIEEAFAESARAVAVASDILSALVNLILNALDAMPHGGTLHLGSGCSGETAWVAVQDNGSGMTPEVESRAFEPLFTTKGEAGTGMGLAMVYAIASQHGGAARLETVEGEGTTVTLSLPVASQL